MMNIDLWEAVVGTVQDVEADVTLLHSLESLVHVRLPHREAVHDGAILVLHTDTMVIMWQEEIPQQAKLILILTDKKI